MAQRQELIAAGQAQSAVVLNRLLAVFTACTVIVVRMYLPDEEQRSIADFVAFTMTVSAHVTRAQLCTLTTKGCILQHGGYRCGNDD